MFILLKTALIHAVKMAFFPALRFGRRLVPPPGIELGSTV